MPVGNRKFRKSAKKLNSLKVDVPNEISGILGIAIGGIKYVEVPTQPGYVYVRLRDNLSELVKARNDQVSPVYGLPVIVVREGNRYKIKSRDYGRYDNWGSSPYVPVHGAQHSFDPSNPGGDPVWVWGRQFMPLAATPSGSVGGPNAIIQGPAVYYQNKSWVCGGGTGTADITPYKPTGSWARMVLVYLDGSSNPQLLGGDSYFATTITGTSHIMPHLPSLPDSSYVPIAGVRLVSGTSVITWDNIYDLRSHIVADGFIPTGTTGHIIQDDGADLPNRDYLNFVGNGFVSWYTGTQVVISGTATSALFPATRIPFAGADMYLTSSPDLWAYTETYGGKGLMIGGLGDPTDSYYLDHKLSVVSDDGDGYGSFASFGYDLQYPMFNCYHARGTEANPSGTMKGDELFVWYWNGFRADAFAGFRTAGRMQVIADQDFDGGLNGAYMDVWLCATGSSSLGKAAEYRRYQTEFGGSITIPTGSAAHPNPSYYWGEPEASGGFSTGTWRQTRVENHLVTQRSESGVWITKSLIDDFGMVRQNETWHAYGGFQDVDYTLPMSGTNQWTPITNLTYDLWQGTEANGMALSNDIMTVENAAHYSGNISITISALTGKDYQIRLYNITQAAAAGYIIGATTTGNANFTNIMLPVFFESAANDQFRMEIRCTTDNTSPILRSSVFYLLYAHD